ncbi:uncharacterized protein PGTG_13344 [Puccinia graminis f. sp. tritici CRL 75-36-700-3]|uniref:Uncharacterized protein n=1 Tax=Puccinia graminis f. sp. tritici (strain CRL 75-36-700-3 / race SCCL) TaxID=418459 RepID=E3KS50_PUCGT|nr:uncharacterized protein PGTG_13344 [Puccinia graminis f. sp. tritici CRL 75-36-700-3]EFP87125.1 hypothetical protein PGTG_13344 [Puccinia graminis f. sp. tritici CRL 75-36-700-3]
MTHGPTVWLLYQVAWAEDLRRARYGTRYQPPEAIESGHKNVSFIKSLGKVRKNSEVFTLKLKHVNKYGAMINTRFVKIRRLPDVPHLFRPLQTGRIFCCLGSVSEPAWGRDLSHDSQELWVWAVQAFVIQGSAVAAQELTSTAQPESADVELKKFCTRGVVD